MLVNITLPQVRPAAAESSSINPEVNVHATTSSNKHALDRDTSKVPQSLQFIKYLKNFQCEYNISGAQPLLLHPHVMKTAWWSWEPCLDFLMLTQHLSHSLMRECLHFLRSTGHPKGSEPTCLAESWLMTEKSLNLTNSDIKGGKKKGFLYLPFDWQLTWTIIFCSQNVQTPANKAEVKNCWHQLSSWQWTHSLSPLSGTQKI